VLVVISGVPGVGKSAVAAELADRLSAVHLSIDPVEDAMLGAGLPSGWQTGVAAYEVTRAAAELNLARGRVVVVDAVNDSEPARATWRTAADRTQVPVVFVLLTCSDEGEHRRRLEGRVRGFGRLAEPTWPQVAERLASYQPWEDCVVVDTGRPLPAVVDEVEAQVGCRPAVLDVLAAPHRTAPGDGDAVAAARAAMTSHWCSTVVPGEDEGWVVRTWTAPPAGQRRPTGTPDVVHRVVARHVGGQPVEGEPVGRQRIEAGKVQLVVQQVHPAG
jgi:predicted kinase